MSRPAALTEGVVVALGERRVIGAFALAGVDLRCAEDATAVRAAWGTLGPEVALVLLSARAAQALGERTDALDSPLTAVIPS
ncbi:hypothetical protein RN607_02490 [Demequina capsici]|uniref:Uncharacterized protein n=1 Tax=Demequina capsici TaxID=3075620 RepID=A0AA96FDE0_9MICO|nr:hypothetical protein [Demequina sp. PMTSA13]WNM27893.1 hypothetical protein RN607_02490 [Demequina sp. PMTSA13]